MKTHHVVSMEYIVVRHGIQQDMPAMLWTKCKEDKEGFYSAFGKKKETYPILKKIVE